MYGFHYCSIAILLVVAAQTVIGKQRQCKKPASFQKIVSEPLPGQSIQDIFDQMSIWFNENKILKWSFGYHDEVEFQPDSQPTFTNVVEYLAFIQRVRSIFHTMNMRNLEYYQIGENYSYSVCETDLFGNIPVTNEEIKLVIRSLIVYKYVPEKNMWQSYRDNEASFKNINTLIQQYQQAVALATG